MMPPAGMKLKPKPSGGAVFLQFVTLVFAVPAVIVGGICVYALANYTPGRHPTEGDLGMVLAVLLPYVVDVPVGLLTLAIGLLVRKGSPTLRWICLVTSLLALSIPLGATLAEHRAEAAAKRKAAEAEADAHLQAGEQGRRAEAQRRMDERRIAGPPRRLTDQQKLALVHGLGNLKGHKVYLTCDSHNQESTRFATDFVDVFRQAGWVGRDGNELKLAGSLFITNGPYVDILGSGAMTSSDCGAILGAFSHAGINVVEHCKLAVLPGQVEVRIGTNWLYPPAPSGP
jgi:hypothetical protein